MSTLMIRERSPLLIIFKNKIKITTTVNKYSKVNEQTYFKFDEFSNRHIGPNTENGATLLDTLKYAVRK